MLLYTLSSKYADVKLAVEAMPITDNLCSSIYADVAELVDALVLGTSVNDVGVQVPSSAPITNLFELNRIDGYENQSEMVDFFLLQKNHPERKDGVCNEDN